MRLIKPSFEIIEQQAGLEGMYKQIELAGRTCYKSEDKITEDKITEDSAKGFVERMIKSGHGAMLEHGTVYLLIPYEEAIDTIGDDWVHEQYSYNPYSVVAVYGNNYYITTNFRVLVENNWMDDLKYICEPTEHHEKRVTVRFICDRGVSHEFVRHRVMSFAQESTRYCNYSKDKFGNELTFIEPCWLEDYNYKDNTYNQLFIDSLRFAEAHYLDLLKKWDDKIPDKRYKTGFRNNPWTPQQARAVLPNSLKTELVVTGFVSDWKHFFELRCASNAHPQAQELAIPLREEFVKRGYIK